MTSAPVIHVFNKSDFSKHRLVTLPPRETPQLEPSSLRLRTRILGLTTNNLTYALLGFAMGWWDIYPQPDDTPAPYNDRNTYACIAAWGYADVVESTAPGIPAGASVFGYLRTGTGTYDVSVEKTDIDGRIIVTDPHRQHVWKIYNRLAVCPPLADVEKSEKGAEVLGWNALMQGLFGTAYNLSTYGFAWDDWLRVHPFGEGTWTAEDASLDDAIVVVLNASGKTGMSFAYALRQCRPEEHQPHAVVGVGSRASKAFLEESGFYDEVLLNDDADAVASLSVNAAPRKAVLLDFGARPGTMAAYTSALSSTGVPLAHFFVGGDNRPAGAEDVMKRGVQRGEGVQVNANALREKGIEVGGQRYFEEFDKAFGEFIDKGAIPGTRLVWGEGMKGWERGWEAFCRDEVRAAEGKVYRL